MLSRDDIIRMAREQGLPETEVEGVFRVNSDDLGRLLAAEREACARACERVEVNWRKSWHSGSEKFAADAASYCANAIRARGNK